jgi:hypothetical protein
MVVDNTVQWLQLNLKETGLPVGFEYFTMNPNIPAGSLPLQGGLYSRLAYSDLWEWVQKQTGYLKAESEWQELAVSNSGNVPFYSSGDGSTTFRVPALKCWVRGASSISEVGGYLTAGLPNITGSMGLAGAPISNANNRNLYPSILNGVFEIQEGQEEHWAGEHKANTFSKDAIIFNAFLSNPIYGASDTVQPPSIVGLWCVKAYGTVTNVGSTDVANLAQGLTQTETRISALETNKVDKAGNAWVVESYRNGTEWYRVWSDGWVEQGGYFEKKRDTALTVTFLKPYVDNEYTFACMLARENGSTPKLTTKTTTGFSMYTASWDYDMYWRTEGKGA